MRATRQRRHAKRFPTALGYRSREGGAVLLEVVLALGLFVFAAAVITSSLNVVVQRTLRLRSQTHALDLAASVLAEIEMGMRRPQSAGPEPFEAPYAEWNWQILASAETVGTATRPGLQQVTVIVRQESGPIVQRLGALLAPPIVGPAFDGGLP